jgi:hypothetical protein
MKTNFKKIMKQRKKESVIEEKVKSTQEDFETKDFKILDLEMLRGFYEQMNDSEKYEWVSNDELERVLSIRNELNSKYFYYFKSSIRISHDDFIYLTDISLKRDYNRVLSEKGIENVKEHKSDWKIQPIMFHDFKHLSLTERHLRCSIEPVSPNKDLYLFLDIPLDFEILLRERNENCKIRIYRSYQK